MRDSLKSNCMSFIENRDILKKAFKFEITYIYPACAALLVESGVRADAERITLARKLLKERTGMFSEFRGIGSLIMAVILSLSEDTEYMLAALQRGYVEIKEEAELPALQYRAILSALVADVSDKAERRRIMIEAKYVYRLMKDNHRFLTSSEDTSFAVLAAVMGKNGAAFANEAESCYRYITENIGWHGGDFVWALSCVLALYDESTSVKCERVLSLYNELYSYGKKFGKGMELPALGVLAMLTDNSSDLAKELVEVDEFLSGFSGYRGLFGMTRATRLFHAGIIITCDYAPQSKPEVRLIARTVACGIAIRQAVAAANNSVG